jgi:hypothetical protein
MKAKRVLFFGLLLLLVTRVDAMALSYRVTSDFPDLNGIYIYWGDITTSKYEGAYADVPMPVYHYAANNYYIGYRGCGAKWVITKIDPPAGPDAETIGGGPNSGLHIRNTTDAAAPPRTEWMAGHVPGVDYGTELNLEVIPVYDLAIDTEGNGSVSRTPDTPPYDEDTLVSLTAEPAAGHAFSGWSGDFVSTDNPAAITMDGDKHITAIFTELGQYSLIVNTVGSGNVNLDPAGGVYYDGTAVTLTADPADAYWSFSGWSGDLSGSATTTTVTMDSAKTVSATFTLLDTDADGISDRDEDAGANGGDGNSDGIADRLQGNVVCLQMHNLTHLVTLESEAGTILSNCQARGNLHPQDSPSWADFPYDFFQFTITGIAPGGATTLVLHLPDNATTNDLNSYYNYGPLPNDPTAQWYRFKYEPSLQIGAVLNGRTVTLHLIDGRIGDDDLTADGTIRDVGGPAALNSASGSGDSGPSPRNEIGSGGGGGCFLQSIQAPGF